MEYQTIIIPSHPHVDTIVAIFLLKKFGKEKYAGIENAKIEVWNTLPENETLDSLFEKGFFLIDIGGDKFDHHSKGKTVSQLVAEDLNIADNSALNKLLVLAERDDKYGLGTISTDPIDKAFGISGLVTNLSKIFSSDPQKVVDLILPLIHAHYLEEERRKELPEEFEKKLKEGKAEFATLKQGDKKLNTIVIESDNPSIIGWLRSSIGKKADVVLQKMSSGHVNIMTRPLKKVDLRMVVASLRQQEALIKRIEIKNLLDLIKPGRIPEVPEWYYDRATNSILNGGINPKGTSPTSIPFENIKELLREGLTYPLLKEKKMIEVEEAEYFFEVRIPIETAKKIHELILSASAGIKLHLPENYHLTLIYLGRYRKEEISQVLEKAEITLKEIKPFQIEIDSKNLKVGEIAGYPKAFYFEISEEKGGKSLRGIKSDLEKIIPKYQVQEFFPHLTIGNAISGMEAKVIEEANIKIKDFKVKFLISKIRLTEIIRKPNGQVVYKSKHYFLLQGES